MRSPCPELPRHAACSSAVAWAPTAPTGAPAGGKNFAGCATHRVATTHVAVSSGRPDAKKVLSIINSGVEEQRRTGELNTILKPYGMVDWRSAKMPALAH